MTKFKISDTFHSPVKMAVIVVVILVFCQLLFLLLKPLVPELIDERSAWVVTVAMLLFYILFNSISTFATKNLAQNWAQSIYGLLLIGAVGYGLSYLISGKTLRDLDGFVDILMIVVIGFLALKSIASSIKGIVLYTKYRDSQRK